MKKLGVTLVEILVVIAILAILAALLFPVFAKAKLSAKVSASSQNLKHFWLGLELYRQDNDEQVEFGSLSQMGLPSAGPGYDNFLRSYTGDPKFTWNKHSEYAPCGWSVTGSDMFRGLIYFGNMISDWPKDVLIYKANNVVLADKNCNTSDVKIDCQFCDKRSIGITLGGALRDRRSSERLVIDQRFYQQ